VPRVALLAACGLIAITGAWMVGDRTASAVAAPHWDAYLRFALTPEAKAGHVKPDLQVIEHLRRVTAWTPGDARAHLALAEACLQHFERVQADAANAMPLGQIRDAALASRFESRQALDAWLARAVGENRQFLDLALWHTRQALASCPLQGHAYVYLAELCFLNGSNDLQKPAFIDQALRVRPYSGSVLMSAGSEAALAEDLPRALEFWRRAFRTGPVAQRQFIEMWGQMQLPVEIVLNEFDPDLPAVRLMQSVYAQRAQDEQVRTLLAFRARKCEQAAQAMIGEQAAPLWLELNNVYRELKRPQQAIEAVRRAAALTPNDFATRHLLAVSLFEQRQFAEAEQHLRWCLERRAGDPQLRELLASAVKGRIGGERISASHDQARWH
jgi:tetratricopeptide (TPR) repeat protein